MSMNKNDRDEKENRGGFSLSEIPIWVHVAILAVIALVVGFTAYKLIKWNAGTAETEE